jgi:hypothetical protein
MVESEEPFMCDYSLHHVASRPAKVADKLITMELAKSNVRGFAAVGELGPKLVIHDSPPELAVCLLPGTELAFDENVEYERPFRRFGMKFLGKAHVDHKVASFRKVDEDDPHVQHDALEFPNGQVLKIAQLTSGQTATVLQLPVHPQRDDHDHTIRYGARARASRVALNRASTRLGMCVPSLETVMLWDAVRCKAQDLSIALAQSFQHLRIHKRTSLLKPTMSGNSGKSQISLRNGVSTTTSLEKRAAQTSKVKSAAKFDLEADARSS